MAKRVTHFSHGDFVAFATRYTVGEATAIAESIRKSGRHQTVNTSREGEVTIELEGQSIYSDGGVFLEGEDLAKYLELKRKQYRKLKNKAKTERRLAAGLPRGQGAYTRVIPGDEREPVDRAPKYVTVGRPKPHGPKDHVTSWTTGKPKA